MDLNSSDLKTFSNLLESAIAACEKEMAKCSDMDVMEDIISEIADYEITLKKVKKMNGE